MKLRFVALAFVAAVLSAPSFAADVAKPVKPVVIPAPIAVRVSPFDGFYAGGNVGYASANRTGCARAYGGFPTSHTCTSGPSFNYDQKGWLVGGQVGINHTLGLHGLVIGAEVNAALSGATGVLNKFSGTGDWHWLATADAKLGWTAGNWMLYVKGGVSVADFEYSSASCTFNSNHQGWNWGVGAEVAVSSKNTLFVDWTRTDFEGKDMACGLVIFPVAVYTKPKMDVVRFGFNHYFN
jgi:opacity protein-like surface antigen